MNETWRGMLAADEPFSSLLELPREAYQYREGLRLGDWHRVLASIRRLRGIRTDLVPAYLTGAEALTERAAASGAEAFPLGAGGGGSVMVFEPEPDILDRLRTEVAATYEEIPFRLMPEGHNFTNC